MRKIVKRIAGPFDYPSDAIRAALLKDDGPWMVPMSALRRYRDGWWVLDRSRGTDHLGSRKWRRSWKRKTDVRA